METIFKHVAKMNSPMNAHTKCAQKPVIRLGPMTPLTGAVTNDDFFGGSPGSQQSQECRSVVALIGPFFFPRKIEEKIDVTRWC